MPNYDELATSIFDRKIDTTLTLDEERYALRRAKAGDDEATIELLYAYSPVLNGAVRSYTQGLPTVPPREELEDVRAQAIVGLLEAIAAFDPARHERLAAVAPGYVANAVSSAAGSASGFHVPERTLKRFFAVLRAAEGNVYDAAALAPSYSMSRETFLSVLSAIRTVGLESLLDEAGELGAVQTGASFEELGGRLRTAEAIVEDRILVEAAFRVVDSEERDVVELAYGFADYDPQPDAEIGDRLDLSRPKVQRVRSGALGKMRDALGVA